MLERTQQIKAQLSNFGFSDYVRHLKTVEEEIALLPGKPLRIAILRSYTAEMVEPILKLRMLLEGYKTEFLWGDYNQYVQEILNLSSPLYDFRPDLILILLRIEELLPDFIEDFGSRPVSEWEALIESRAQQLADLTEPVRKNLQAQILFQNLSLPGVNYYGIYDAQQSEGQSYLVNRFNHFLAKELGTINGAFIWDFNRFVHLAGLEAIYDPKMWYFSKNPFKASIYPKMVNDLLRYILSIIGKSRKCIVVDLDHTLWGGVAGEDGISGVALGHDYPGNCYLDFQKGLLRLYNRGIILAINSKNNEEDALEIIDNHPYMILRRRHFAAMKINWKDKVTNLKALAQELNIGIDSMIFIDDSPIECELVRQRCPECEVVCLPEKVYLIPEVLESLNGIENIRLTDEDKEKGKMYQDQAVRREFEKSFDNLDEFLEGLNIEVKIEAATDFSVPRIAQLTQKTNQMNLTTRRYTESNIKAFVDGPDTYVFSVSSKDRFGDHGIIGVFILKINGEECFIDTFLLSCRVIGRNIEQSMIAFIADFARKRGIKTLIGEYIPTPKNRPAEDMYRTFQFERINETLFKANPKTQQFENPSYIKMTPNIEST